MVVIEYADGTRDYATPVSAYENTDMVSGPEEAKRNNLDAPKVIEELGGSACKTALTEDSRATTGVSTTRKYTTPLLKHSQRLTTSATAT